MQDKETFSDKLPIQVLNLKQKLDSKKFISFIMTLLYVEFATNSIAPLSKF